MASIKQSFKKAHIALIVGVILSTLAFADVTIPQWCRALPRPEYKNLQKVPVAQSKCNPLPYPFKCNEWNDPPVLQAGLESLPAIGTLPCFVQDH